MFSGGIERDSAMKWVKEILQKRIKRLKDVFYNHFRALHIRVEVFETSN